MLDITRITSAIAELISNNDGDFADLVVGGNSTDNADDLVTAELIDRHGFRIDVIDSEVRLTAAGETYVITVTRAL